MRLTWTSRLDRLLATYEDAPFSYAEVGATRDSLPEGYHHTRFRRIIGKGDRDFARVADLVMAWEMQRGAGMPAAVAGPAAAGMTAVLAAGRPLGLVVPCRVVYTLDEPRRRGFAYGTLPGHPECGEEAFMVTIDEGGAVWLEILAFSRPGSALVKLAGPLNRLIQQIALRGYARSLRRQLTASGRGAGRR